MKKPRNNENHIHQQKAHRDVTSEKSSAVAAPAGRAAYRDDYQCDYGPDLDEPLDQIESGRDF